MLTGTQRNGLIGGVFTFLIFFSLHLSAQTRLSGKIIDAKSGAPIAFAHILYDPASRMGTLSDIDGNFLISSLSRIDSLVISHLGYGSQTYLVPADPGFIEISLQKTDFSLDAVQIEAKRNPAEALMQKVIAHKKKNNPDKIPTYTCETYNKAVYDWYLPKDSLPNDSSFKKFVSRSALLVMESVTERKFARPDRLEEVVVGTRVSGFKSPDFAPLSTDIQPFAFYEELVVLLDRTFINPIADGSLNRYQYRMIDTIYQPSDTVYVVDFQPKEGKNFEALSGQLYINTFQFAIQNVIAKPTRQGLMEFEVEQKYSLIDGNQWFPEQLNFEILIKNFSDFKMGMQIQGKSYVRKVEIAPDMPAKTFGFKQMRLEENANEKSPDYWMEKRQDSLSRREEETYVVMDSLGEKINLDGILNFANKIGNGKFPLGWVDLDLEKLYLYNDYEGHRLGMGILTNEKISKRIRVGGYFAYGTRDKAWKYGGSLEFDAWPKQEWKWRFEYQNDVWEPGQSELSPARGYSYVRNLLVSRMDRTKKMSISTSWRMLKYAQVNITGRKYSREPLYSYQFETWGGDSLVNSTDIQVRLRYAFREKIVESFGQNYQMGSKYPILEIAYTRGIPELLESEWGYEKWEAEITQTWSSKAWGKSTLRIRGGLTQGEIPANWLFYGAGVKHPEIWLLVPHSFQTMRPYEFLSDQYVYGFFVQELGSRLFAKGKFRPRLELIQAFGWGRLSQPQLHQGISFQTLEKGFYESGIMIRQLLKIKYLNLAYIGIGGGVFYRYGPYHLPELQDNFAIKLALDVSTF